MNLPPPQFGLVAESIDGPGVRVRRYRDDDVDDVRAGCADPVTQRFLPLLPSPYTRQDAIWWIAEGAGAAFERGGGNFAIADPVTDRLLGGIGVNHEAHGNGEIGYWVAPWGRGRGGATAATRALTDYAFATGYGRLQLRTEYENTTSQRVAIAAGYTRESVQRKAGVARGGERYDLIVWTRIAGDPPGPSPRLLPDPPGGGLTDGVVELRPLGAADVDDEHRLHVLPDVWSTWSAAPPTRAETERTCRHAAADWLAGTAARLTIRDAATGGYAGHAVLRYVQPTTGPATTGQATTGHAALGYVVRPDRRGRGYATRAVVLLVRWAVGSAGIARIIATTLPDNQASQRVLEKAGFTREGYQRGHLPGPEGGRSDVVAYGLLATDLRESDRG